MRQIYVDTLLNELTLWKAKSVGYENWVLGRVIELVKKQPIVDDAPVVYCQDCDYFLGEQRWCINDQIANVGKTCVFAKKSEKEE